MAGIIYPAADSAGRKTEELAGLGKGLERRLTPGILRTKLELFLKPRSRKRTQGETGPNSDSIVSKFLESRLA